MSDLKDVYGLPIDQFRELNKPEEMRSVCGLPGKNFTLVSLENGKVILGPYPTLNMLYQEWKTRQSEKDLER